MPLSLGRKFNQSKSFQVPEWLTAKQRYFCGRDVGAKPHERHARIQRIAAARDLPFTTCASASKPGSPGAGGRACLGNRQRDELGAVGT